MFYLVSFLTLLISLLIYMIDPVPTNLRRDTDIRSSEGYVAAFFNQHQAARDYLEHWLNVVYPAKYVEVFSLNSVDLIDNNVPPSSGPSIVAPMAAVLAVPGGPEDKGKHEHQGLDDFMPPAMHTERRACTNDVNPGETSCSTQKEYVGLLKFSTGNKGAYMSALICLKKNETPGSSHFGQLELAPCYTYDCLLKNAASGVGEIVSGNTKCISSGAVSNPQRIRFSDDVIPYVITYSNGNAAPEWWGDQTSRTPANAGKGKGNPKVLRQELWRRAIARRTHSSQNCGILYGRNITGAWYGWFYDKTRKYNRVRPAKYDELAHEYCLDNGQRCINVLPLGIQTFLESVLGSDNLNETFFCMSPLYDPYEKIASSVYHFDWINATAQGAPWPPGSRGSSDLWTPVNNIIDGPASPTSENNTVAFCNPNPNCFDNGSSGIALNGKTITMPFNYSNKDFTLSIVMDFDGSFANGIILGRHAPSETGKAFYGLGYQEEAGQDPLRFYTGGLISADTQPQYAVEISTSEPIEGRHVVTIMRRDNEMYLLIDNYYYEKAGINWTVNSSSPGDRVTFGGAANHGDLAVLDVRFYDSALSKRTLTKLFELDVKRYSINPLAVNTSATDNALYPIGKGSGFIEHIH